MSALLTLAALWLAPLTWAAWQLRTTAWMCRAPANDDRRP
jgi:hypothetical protein